MSQDAGTVYAEIRVALDKLASDLNQVQTMFKNTAGQVDSSVKIKNKSLESLKSTITAVSTSFLAIKSAVNMFVSAIKQGYEWVEKQTKAYNAQQMELAKLNAVVQSTGAIAWTTGDSLMKMANQLSNVTGYAQNEIMKMQAILIGFRGITGETFERTTKVILDMASVMGTDLVSAANTVGKAIDTPVQGMSALSRQGFVFTQQDKEMARQMTETGNIMGAREIILKELEQTYMGTAQAIKEATSATEAYARRETAKSNLAVERGRQTSALSTWFANFRAEGMELTQQQLKIEQDARNAIDRMGRIAQARTDVMAQMERMSSEMANASIEDYANMKEGLGQLQLELTRLNALAAEDELSIVLQRWNKLYKDWRSVESLPDTEQNLQLFKNTYVDINKELENATAKSERLANDVKTIENINASVITTQQDNNALLKIATDEIAKITAAEKTRERTVAETQELFKRQAITADEYYSRMIGAFTAEVNITNEVYNGALKLETTAENRLMVQNAANDALSRAIALQAEWNKKSENRTMTETEFLKARDKIMNDYTNKMEHLGRMQIARQMSEDDYEKEALSLRQNQVEALDDLLELAKATANEYPKSYTILEEINKALKEQDTIVKSIKENDTMRKKTNELMQKYNEIGLEQYEINKLNYEIEKNRVEEMILLGEVSENVGQAYLTVLAQIYNKQRQQDFIDLISDYENKIKKLGMTTIEAIQNERKEAILLAQVYKNMDGFDKLIDNINEYYDLLEKNNAWETFTKNATTAINQITQLFSAISTTVMAFAKNDTDFRISEFERANLELQDYLDKELQQRLYAAGLAEAATSEQHDAELQRMISTGDHRLIWEAEQAKKRYEIEKELAEKKDQAEKEMQRRKAQEEYRYAMSAWRIQLAMGYASAAQAILTAIASVPPVAYPFVIPIATAIGGANIAAIYAAQPQLQQFATGGIVSGDPFRGDSQLVKARGKEAFLTEQDQTELFNIIRNGSGNEPIYINVTIPLDGEILAEKVFEVGTRGNAFINARGVIR